MTQLLLQLQQFKKYQVNSILPKAVVPAVTVPAAIITLELLGIQNNTSIAKTSKQSVEWYRDIIT